MITLYSGTPGSGKSLHVANVIYKRLKSKKDNLIIANFPISSKYFKDYELKKFMFIDTQDMLPSVLWDIGEKFLEGKKLSVQDKENAILLVIDECQLLFNARSWQNNSKCGWTQFFALHRHAGFKIILVTQMDTSIDKQVRGLIEYQCIHRKVKNMGTIGFIANLIAGGGLFRANEYWYPIKQQTDGYWFKYKKRLDGLYDTHAIFEKPNFISKDEWKKIKNLQ